MSLDMTGHEEAAGFMIEVPLDWTCLLLLVFTWSSSFSFFTRRQKEKKRQKEKGREMYSQCKENLLVLSLSRSLCHPASLFDQINDWLHGKTNGSVDGMKQDKKEKKV